MLLWVRMFVFRYQLIDLTYEGEELPVIFLNFTIDKERMFGHCDMPKYEVEQRGYTLSILLGFLQAVQELP
jgi:hypothetical protein